MPETLQAANTSLDGPIQLRSLIQFKALADNDREQVSPLLPIGSLKLGELMPQIVDSLLPLG